MKVIYIILAYLEGLLGIRKGKPPFFNWKPLVDVMGTKVRANTVGEAIEKAERIWDAEDKQNHPEWFDSKGNRKGDLEIADYSKEMARCLTTLAMCAREYMKEEEEERKKRNDHITNQH